MVESRDRTLLMKVLGHAVAGVDPDEQIKRLRAAGLEDDDLLYLGFSESDLEKAPGTKTYWVTAHPYANQDGTIEVPANIPADEVEDYIYNHFDEIEFGEPELDYKGTGFEFGKE